MDYSGLHKEVYNTIRVIVFYTLVTSCWAGTFHNRNPYFQNRNYNNPFIGYQNGNDFNQNPFPYPQRFPQHGFRPFQNNPFGGFGQQSVFPEAFNKLFQNQRNPFFNLGNNFGLGQDNISQGFPGQNPNVEGQYNRQIEGQDQYNRPVEGPGQYNRPVDGQGQYNRPVEGQGQYNRPVEGQGQYNRPVETQPMNYGPNNPNSNNKPGQESVYNHGELPFSGLFDDSGPTKVNPYGQIQPHAPTVLTNQVKPSLQPGNVHPPSSGDQGKLTTSQSPTSGQRPSILPNPGKPSSSDQGKRTTSQSPTSGQRPSILPNSAYPEKPSSSDQGKRTTSQSPTSGQRPSILPNSETPAQYPSNPAKGQPIGSQKPSPASAKAPEIIVEEADNEFDTLLVNLNNKPDGEGEATEAAKNSKAPEDSNKASGSNSKKTNDYGYDHALDEGSYPTKSNQDSKRPGPPKLDVRGTTILPKSETQKPKSKTELPVPAWEFIEEEIIS